MLHNFKNFQREIQKIKISIVNKKMQKLTTFFLIQITLNFFKNWIQASKQKLSSHYFVLFQNEKKSNYIMKTSHSRVKIHWPNKYAKQRLLIIIRFETKDNETPIDYS